MAKTTRRIEEPHRLKLAQTEKYEGDEWWSWSVWLDAAQRDLSDVDYVEYTLHPTFPQPVQRVSTRANNFKLSTSGWGVFPIYARVVRKDGTVQRLKHTLKLHFPDGKLNKK
jgi:transcription initiation factor IIF auxiliary subunit